MIGVRVGGGSAMLQRVTATGCALGGLVAAYLAVTPTPLIGLAAAHVHVAVAAEIAEAAAAGPGTFAVAYLDALYTVDADTLRARAQLEVHACHARDPGRLAVRAGVGRDLASLKVG